MTTVTGRSGNGLAFDVAGPDADGADAGTILLVHAGVSDRRMWQPQWEGLTTRWRTIRVDLRGL